MATRTVKTQAESIGEFGSVSLTRSAKACIPSEANLNAIAKLEGEIKEMEAALANMPEAAKHYIAKGLEGMQYKLTVMRANIGNPSNLSERERFMLNVAAKRLLKYGLADITSTATFVLANVDQFPVKGTKY